MIKVFDGMMLRLSCVGDDVDTRERLHFAVKDLIDIEGHVTGAGNPCWAKTHGAATQNAPVIDRLIEAGARPIAKSCTDELAYSLDGINVHYGCPINTQYPDRIPGGSSSGSASMVASGLVDFALGTDTSGSIRVPSSHCGIFGYRPTHGAIPTDGVVPLAPSFDTVGCFARDLDLLIYVSEIMLDARSSAAASTDADPRFVFCQPLFSAAASAPLVSRSLVQSITGVPHTDCELLSYQQLCDWADRYRILQSYEAWQMHGEWIQKERPEFAPAIKDRFDFASTVTLADYNAALPIREQALELLNRIIKDDSYLVLPATWDRPPLIADLPETILEHRIRNYRLSCLGTICGAPQIVLPVEIDGTKKLGVSLLGLPGSDLGLMAAARSFQAGVGGKRSL